MRPGINKSTLVRTFQSRSNRLIEKQPETLPHLINELKNTFEFEPFVVQHAFDSFLEWLRVSHLSFQAFRLEQEGKTKAFILILDSPLTKNALHQSSMVVISTSEKTNSKVLFSALKFFSSFSKFKIQRINRPHWDRRVGANLVQVALKLKLMPMQPSYWYEGKVSTVFKKAEELATSFFDVIIKEKDIHREIKILPEVLRSWGAFLFTENYERDSGAILIILKKGSQVAGMGFGIRSRLGQEQKYDGYFGWKKRLGKNGVLLRSFIMSEQYRLNGGLNEIFYSLCKYLRSTYPTITKMGGDTSEPNMRFALEYYGFKFPFVSNYSEFGRAKNN